MGDMGPISMGQSHSSGSTSCPQCGHPRTCDFNGGFPVPGGCSQASRLCWALAIDRSAPQPFDPCWDNSILRCFPTEIHQGSSPEPQLPTNFPRPSYQLLASFTASLAPCWSFLGWSLKSFSQDDCWRTQPERDGLGYDSKKEPVSIRVL